MVSFLQKAEIFYQKHERQVSSFALFTGFVFDWLTLQRIDLLYENLVMLFYLVVAGAGIVAANYLREYPSQKVFLAKVETYAPLLVQFAFGGLFSAFFIFYNRSAALSSSWPFVLALLILLIGNEFFKEYYRRITFQVSVYFAALFSFSIFFIPVLLRDMGAGVFLLSGGTSLIAVSLFSLVLLKAVPKSFSESRKMLTNSIVIIFLSLNALYFTNLIPPIPLALKDIGVYYSVERAGEDYRVIGPERNWLDALPLVSSRTVEWVPGAPLYVFSSVFAPTRLNTRIVHDWQYFDEITGHWTSVTRVSYDIRGGRDGGYRGFSMKQNLFEGKWRVDVKTSRGQVIGRLRFDIERAISAPELEERII